MRDRMTGHSVRLTDEQVALVQRLQRGQFGDVSFDPYEVGSSCWPWGWGTCRAQAHPPLLAPQPAVDFFSGDLMIHPVTNRPADKRSFIPSLVEKEKVGVGHPWGAPACPAPTPLTRRLCRSPAWCTPSRWAGSSLAGLGTTLPASTTCGPRRIPMRCWVAIRCTFLLPSWPCPATQSPTTRLPSTCPARRRWAWCTVESGLAPGLALAPGSLPPPQRLAWEQQEPDERKLGFLPRRFPSLRAVPAYGRFIQERFERCLDLYLCPRQRKMRVRRGAQAGAGSGDGRS